MGSVRDSGTDSPKDLPKGSASPNQMHYFLPQQFTSPPFGRLPPRGVPG